MAGAVAAGRLGKLLNRLAPSLRHASKPYSNFAADVETWNQGNLATVPPTTESETNRLVHQQSLLVGDTPIHFEKTGTGKHVLFLLPGALGSSVTDFKPQLSHLSKDMFTLLAWDPPGYGQSRPPNRAWPPHFLKKDAENALKFLDAAGMDKVSLAGWSDGGITALIMASLAPERIRKLVVWGANAYHTPEDAKTFEGLRDIDRWSEGMREPFMKVYGEEYFREQWSNWVDAFNSYLTLHAGDICKSNLPDIICPTLIIHGEKDPLLPRFHADFLHKNIKNSRLHSMPQGKHNLHLRFYKEFNSILQHFLLE